MEILFNDEEFAKVYQLTKQAGFHKPAEFLRNYLLHKGKIIAALSPKERKTITYLGNIGTNLWEIRKDFEKRGITSDTLDDLAIMIDEFTEIKNYFKAKILKK